MKNDKVLIVYFTTTGNTQMLAEALHEGFVKKGIECVIKNVSDATVEEVDEYDLLCLGCSASGTEELDDTEFDPYFESIIEKINQKPLFLFGCYGWGVGDFMKTWENRVALAGGVLAHPSFIQLETPNEENLQEVKQIAGQLTI